MRAASNTPSMFKVTKILQKTVVKLSNFTTLQEMWLQFEDSFYCNNLESWRCGFYLRAATSKGQLLITDLLRKLLANDLIRTFYNS